MAGESTEMDSLFEGMDFVMPLEDESLFLGGGSPVNSKVKASEAPEDHESLKPAPPVAKPPLSSSPSLDPVSPSSGHDLELSSRSSISALPAGNLSEPLPPASPPSQRTSIRDPNAPLDESLFSGLTMSSVLDDENTTDDPPNLTDGSDTATGLSGTQSVIRTSVGSIQQERTSFDDPATTIAADRGDRIGNGGSTESILAALSDVHLSSPVKYASSGTPPISKTGSSQLTPSPSVKPSMRRRKTRSMKIGYGREEEENEELASRKAGIRDAFGAALLGKDPALNSSSSSTPRYGLSRESSQSAIYVDESSLGSNLIVDGADLNGVELVIEKSPSMISQYSTLEVYGIERVASREISGGVAPAQLASNNNTPDVNPTQTNNIAEGDEQANDQVQGSTVDETRSDIELANETPSPDPESTVASLETGSAVDREEKRGASDAIQETEDDIDIESMSQQREWSIEERLERVQNAIAHKLKVLHRMISTVSGLRKAAVQKRRQAAEKVAVVSTKYKELEAELDAACESEDFEKADSMSRIIAEAEADMAQAGEAFVGAEAASDSAASKVQEVLDMQVAVEEQGFKVLILLKQEAEDAAIEILRDAQETASRETERLLAEEKTAEQKQKDVNLGLKGIEEANAELNNEIDDLTKAESMEKVALVEKRNQLDLELQDLMAQVRRKEAEIAEFDERITAVDDKMSIIAATFEKQKTALGTELEILATSSLQLEKDCSLISQGKQGVEQLLADAEKESLTLENVGRQAGDAGKAMQGAVEMKKAVALALMQSREKRTQRAEKEKQTQAEAQLLRHNAASTRVLLQELTSLKVKLSQELGAVKDRISFIEKRGPELDTEKKVAAAARNFKVAGRLAAEAKVLNAEKEVASVDMERITKELEKVDTEAEVKLSAMADVDDLITAKEKEGAMAHCERLRLVAAAARDERDIAIALEDFEEGQNLNSEAQVADAEAEALQRLYQLEGREYDKHSNLSVIEDADSKDKEEAMANCERLRLQAAAARAQRDAAIELDQFEEAETLHSKAETADAEADRLQRIYQLMGREYESQTNSGTIVDSDSKDKELAMTECERLRLVAATARDERDTAVELDEFKEAEVFNSKAEAADVEADKLQSLFQLEGAQYECQTNMKAGKKDAAEE